MKLVGVTKARLGALTMPAKCAAVVMVVGMVLTHPANPGAPRRRP